jgi:hypothetical protein
MKFHELSRKHGKLGYGCLKRPIFYDHYNYIQYAFNILTTILCIVYTIFMNLNSMYYSYKKIGYPPRLTT